jgi:hypothetical protein
VPEELVVGVPAEGLLALEPPWDGPVAVEVLVEPRTDDD